MEKSVRAKALLAGVCSRIAQLLKCDVWVLRVIFLVLLLAKTFLAIIAYIALTVVFRCTDHLGKSKDDSADEPPLDSPELATRNRRIEELDRRFREWEDSLPR